MNILRNQNDSSEIKRLVKIYPKVFLASFIPVALLTYAICVESGYSHPETYFIAIVTCLALTLALSALYLFLCDNFNLKRGVTHTDWFQSEYGYTPTSKYILWLVLLVKIIKYYSAFFFIMTLLTEDINRETLRLLFLYALIVILSQLFLNFFKKTKENSVKN